MAKKYFKCNPENLCNGASCCKDLVSVPGLSIGDYLRLSEHTGESVESIWRTKGDIGLFLFVPERPNLFTMTLALLHNPCPYLTEDRCTVYENRPIACAEFPWEINVAENGIPENFITYDCLKDVRFTPEQKKFRKELDDLLKEEGDLVAELIWSEISPFVEINCFTAYLTLAEQAKAVQYQRDSKGRSSRLEEATSRAFQLNKRGDFRNGIKGEVLASLLSPVIYSILEDRMAEKLASLVSNKEVRRAHQRTSKKLRRLYRRNK